LQQSILALLTLALLVSAAAGWLGRDRSRGKWRRYRLVAAIGALAVVPFLGFVLRTQARAIGTLAAWGVVPHPAIRSVQGLPTMHTGGGSWTFDVDASADSIQAFYLETGNVGEWHLVIQHPSILVFDRDGAELMITVYRQRTPTRVDFDIAPAAAISDPPPIRQESSAGNPP